MPSETFSLGNEIDQHDMPNKNTPPKTRWIPRYRKHLAEIARTNSKVLGLHRGQVVSEMKDILAPLISNPDDSLAVATFMQRFWEKWGKQEIARAKSEAAIQRRLQPLYSRLVRAKPEEWEAYAKMRLEMQIAAAMPLLRAMRTNAM